MLCGPVPRNAYTLKNFRPAKCGREKAISEENKTVPTIGDYRGGDDRDRTFHGGKVSRLYPFPPHRQIILWCSGALR
jgi:hypothetical protein